MTTIAEQELLDSLDGLRDKFEDRIMIVFELDLIIEELEALFDNVDYDISKLKHCPKCGDTKNPLANFCSRCGYSNGYCKHSESGYRQDGKLFCLNCKKILRYNTETQESQS